MTEGHQARSDDDRLRPPEQAIRHEPAEQRRQVHEAGVQPEYGRRQLLRRARAGDVLNEATQRIHAGNLADVLRQEEVVGEVQHQQRLHAVVREPFPELAEGEPAEACGMAEEGAVAASVAGCERSIASGIERGHGRVALESCESRDFRR